MIAFDPTVLQSPSAERKELAVVETPPIIFLVSSEVSVLKALETDLSRRFGNDTRIIGADGPAAGMAQLTALADDVEPVALLIADQRMPEMTGVEFLASAHTLHPLAKRILLVERDYTTANPIVPAMMLGQIDYHLVKPWFPDHGLYPAVSEFLASWARSKPQGFALFQIVAPENSAARARDPRPPTRFNTPYTFHPTDSEEGAALLREVGQTGSRRASRPSVTTGGCWSTRRTPTSSKLSAAARASVWTSTTSRSSVPGPPASQRLSMRPRKVSTHSCSSGRSPAVKRARALASATSPASRGVSAATTSRIARASRHGCSERTWSSRRRRRRSELSGAELVVQVADGQEVTARAVVLATGVYVAASRDPAAGSAGRRGRLLRRGRQ